MDTLIVLLIAYLIFRPKAVKPISDAKYAYFKQNSDIYEEIVNE